MRADDAKKEICSILGCSIEFEGHFEACFQALKETQQASILEWVKNCKESKCNFYPSAKYDDLIGFILRIGSNLRAILTKEKNKYFLTLFLDKHKYYEMEIKRLGF